MCAEVPDHPLLQLLPAAVLTPATTVIVVDEVAERLPSARGLGATHTVSAGDADVAEAVLALADGKGAGGVVETTDGKGARRVVETADGKGARRVVESTGGVAVRRRRCRRARPARHPGRRRRPAPRYRRAGRSSRC
ncbi:hypothetical protein [Streptomyces avermitilis]|uniref:hypothetical protein n=1 Tax=Streptomyces avermitilis TaxID=33903 RepID=UPI0036A3D9F9